MDELWQLYDEQGRPLENKGAVRGDVFGKGLLHGASHVWIWRETNGAVEILLQKRSATKETWPNLYDISAAGHIDVNENPLTAAVRETCEEIGLDVVEPDLNLIGVHKAYMRTENAEIENEFQWLYLYKMPGSLDFTLQKSEVESLHWQSLEDFKAAVQSDPANYVPHGALYFSTIIETIEFQQTNRTHDDQLQHI